MLNSHKRQQEYQVTAFLQGDISDQRSSIKEQSWSSLQSLLSSAFDAGCRVGGVLVVGIAVDAWDSSGIRHLN